MRCRRSLAVPAVSSRGRGRDARTLAGKVDGKDLLLGNVESQHRYAAQLNTHANDVAERWVGSCRRDLLDHVIIRNERHLIRLMSSYVLYYHQDRTHLGLAKDTPASRPTEIRSARERKIQSFPGLGGLHHGYAVAA